MKLDEELFGCLLMNHQDIRTLKILEEIEKSSRLSQRYLAEHLSISLGLVNSFLKQLAQKEFYKVTTLPKNRIKYMLTPKGVVEKNRLTYAYIQFSYQFYGDARQKIKRTLKKLEEDGMQDIVFYGTSDLAEIAYVSLQETPLKFKAVVDDQHKGSLFLGHPIQSFNALNTISFDKILITAFSATENPVDILMKKNIHKSKIMLIQ
jgi:DNA-binding MarR family transcriptional regulator